MKKENNFDRLEIIVNKLDKKIDTMVKTTQESIELLAKTTQASIDSLARMTQEAFSTSIADNNAHYNSIEQQLKNISRGQEDNKLRLDNTAHRFEVHELQKRVDRLEKHAGISK